MFQNCGYDLSCVFRKRDLWYNDLWDEQLGDRLKTVFSPDVILCGWLGSKHPLTIRYVRTRNCGFFCRHRCTTSEFSRKTVTWLKWPPWYPETLHHHHQRGQRLQWTWGTVHRPRQRYLLLRCLSKQGCDWYVCGHDAEKRWRVGVTSVRITAVLGRLHAGSVSCRAAPHRWPTGVAWEWERKFLLLLARHVLYRFPPHCRWQDRPEAWEGSRPPGHFRFSLWQVRVASCHRLPQALFHTFKYISIQASDTFQCIFFLCVCDLTRADLAELFSPVVRSPPPPIFCLRTKNLADLRDFHWLALLRECVTIKADVSLCGYWTLTSKNWLTSVHSTGRYVTSAFSPHLTYPLTARDVGASQMSSQPNVDFSRLLSKRRLSKCAQW